MITRVVTAAALSNLGDGLRVVALPLLAAALTSDPLLVSGLVVAAYLPWVLFGLPIGSVVDRGRPEVFMLVANIGRAVLLGSLTVGLATGLTSIWLLYVVAFLLGIGEAIYDNASQSLVPRLVADRQLETANGALVTAERVGQDLIGPAVAGVLFTATVVLPFGLNAVLLAVAGALLIGIRTEAPRLQERGGVLAETVAGMRWLWQDRFVRRLILTGACLVFTTSVWESTLVLLATGPVGLSAAGYGLVLGLGALGGVGGALATPYPGCSDGPMVAAARQPGTLRRRRPAARRRSEPDHGGAGLGRNRLRLCGLACRLHLDPAAGGACRDPGPRQQRRPHPVDLGPAGRCAWPEVSPRTSPACGRRPSSRRE